MQLFATFNDVYNQILTDGHARVFTTSWGCAEITCTSSGNMNTDDAIFSSMVGQGWTLMAASGDEGATAGCGDYLRVQYPASDPNVVGVGGTILAFYTNDTFAYEIGWQGSTSTGACAGNGGGSTGGCSVYYSAPSYQTTPYWAPAAGAFLTFPSTPEPGKTTTSAAVCTALAAPVSLRRRSQASWRRQTPTCWRLA